LTFTQQSARPERYSDTSRFDTMPLLLNFCLPNFYFHATTAYDILRQSGVELGKRDFMGTPPQL
jgi:hypothetical protein